MPPMVWAYRLIVLRLGFNTSALHAKDTKYYVSYDFSAILVLAMLIRKFRLKGGVADIKVL
jgi:hypothetical protein